ncbi:MAG: hypothetical protein MJ181_10295 [Treponema sp.]|nr:hypothetical protein [Treponema sp.]
MKKRIIAVLAAVLSAAAVSAYAPAIGGESLFELSSTPGLTYASSVAGGGVNYITPASISVNPALTAKEQRVGVNAGYGALVTTGDNKSFGSAFQLGLLVPFKWAVVTGECYGLFPNTPSMTIDNSFTFKGGLAKEITEHLNVGIGMNAGFEWGNVSDWGLGMSLGFVYDIPQLSFMKDFRYGVSISNLGKNYASDPEKDFLSSYPGFMTIRAGAAALLYSNDVLKIGGSLDLSTPCFMNLIVDTGFQLTLKDMLTISVSEKINMKESVNGVSNYIPSIGMMFNFKFNTKNDYLASHDWSESEMTVGTAYKQLYNNVTVVAADVDLRMGLKDETPPEILIWFDEEEDE